MTSIVDPMGGVWGRVANAPLGGKDPDVPSKLVMTDVKNMDNVSMGLVSANGVSMGVIVVLMPVGLIVTETEFVKISRKMRKMTSLSTSK